MEISTSNKIYSVSELTYAIKSILENKFRFISIKGEVSNFKHQSSGHLYFSIKDKNAQISSAMFRQNAKSLTKMPKDGDQVIVEGEISVYPPRGNYQIIVRKLRFEGVGDLLVKLHELKEKLKQMGWFEKDIKKKLPFFPKRIGVITSPTGSVIQDILNVLKRRFSNFNLILNPTKVQGYGAKEEIAQAIYDFNKYNLCDVLIIGRGGGSLEDLWAFNEEIVAKAIFESKIPIISAVGHETDVSISDFVADVRAPTPSAAAELAVKEKSHILDTLNNYQKQILKHTVYLYKNDFQKLKSYIQNPYLSSSTMLLGKQMQMIDDKKSSIENAVFDKIIKNKEILKIFSNQIKSLRPAKQIEDLREQLANYKKRIDLLFKNYLDLKKERLIKLISHLKAIDPKNLLKKGYSICFNEKTSSIILSKDDIESGDKIAVLVSDGKIHAKVEGRK